MSEKQITLDTFCVDLSSRDKRVEMIGAFHFSEKMAGRGIDTQTNYQQRFVNFCTKST